jgi:two-component system chemotaxis sensor kinase CheA
MATDRYRYFRIEARELLDQLAQGILRIESGELGGDLLAALLRAAHTLKGAARVVKQREIADLAHHIEDTLEPYRLAEHTAIDSGAVESVLQMTTQMRTYLEKLDGPPTASTSVPEVQSDVATATATVPTVPVAFNAVPDDIDDLLDGIGAAAVELASLRHDSDGFEALAREIAAAREAAERLRLVPADAMFVTLQVLARDAARGTQKTVDFTTIGGDVRLDAEVFSGMQQVLMQAVRNAVVHGIESAAQRSACNKPIRGQISIEVHQHGRQATFVCRDDGRGIDFGAVRRALIRRGMAPADAAQLEEQALIECLLRGGLSTASSVTQHAGRGIGVDLMRDVTVRLRGEISLTSQPGAGTTLTITVPVTVSAVRGLVVDAGGTAVAIPLDAVRRALRIAPADLAHSNDGLSILYEGTVVPFATLHRALRQTAHADSARRTWSTLIVEGANALAAVAVENLRGAENLVVRPLPAYAPGDRLIAGASLQADGRPQLVLDPQHLVEFVKTAHVPGQVANAQAIPVLIIDDSLTTRMLEQSILQSAGYEADIAVSAEDGLEKARQRHYALFLVDVEMPGMDGFGFIQQIRADPVLKSTPAILVTSRAAPEDLARGRQVGAQGYIVKGEFDQGKLLERIRSLVEKR